jgi:hypothetical protein
MILFRQSAEQEKQLSQIEYQIKGLSRQISALDFSFQEYLKMQDLMASTDDEIEIGEEE